MCKPLHQLGCPGLAPGKEVSSPLLFLSLYQQGNSGTETLKKLREQDQCPWFEVLIEVDLYSKIELSLKDTDITLCDMNAREYTERGFRETPSLKEANLAEGTGNRTQTLGTAFSTQLEDSCGTRTHCGRGRSKACISDAMLNWRWKTPLVSTHPGPGPLLH